MSTTKAVEVVSVQPIEFNFVLKMETDEDVDVWVADLKRRYPCIGKMKMLWGDNDPIGIAVCSFRVTMDEDADYQQLCALRAELKP